MPHPVESQPLPSNIPFGSMDHLGFMVMFLIYPQWERLNMPLLHAHQYL
jgi:hypothetical protein